MVHLAAHRRAQRGAAFGIGSGVPKRHPGAVHSNPTCASGISPSGPVHLGNLRELMTPHLVADEGDAKKVLRLMDQLEDNDDVQDVFANFDIPEQVLEAVAG